MNSSKKTARRLVLKEKHPTAVKIAKLCDLANELGITFSFYDQKVIVTDVGREKNLPPLFLEDIENDYGLLSFPFEMEYKLVYDNPEFLEQEKLAQNEQDRIRNEQLRLSKEKEYQKIKDDAAARAKELEAGERLILAKLKEKYENES